MIKLKEINGKFYMEGNVVMLATDKKSNIMMWNERGQKKDLFNFLPLNIHESKVVYQHLYFLSNEEIKGGDWYFDPYENKILQCLSHMVYINTMMRKVIATTDTSLRLPQPSKEFIQAFTKSYNEGKPITKVLVEYDVITLNEDWSKRPVVVTNEYKLKVNSSNEITIKKVKDSYTREELRPIFLKLCHDTADYIEKGYDEKTEFNIDKWIEENL